MAHHAFVVYGDPDEAREQALALAESLGLSRTGNPDNTQHTYDHLSGDDARQNSVIASRAPVTGDQKLLFISAQRFFHAAQNALLKTFEEPPPGTTIVLAVPSEGLLYRTLRSRLLPLTATSKSTAERLGESFLALSGGEREKYVEQILAKAKEDKEESKRLARREALELAQGIFAALYRSRREPGTQELAQDLARLIPILHESSAPLKPVLEHLLLTLPEGPQRAVV